MNKKQIWLAVSLFCRQEQWHYLVEKGIRPFLAVRKARKYIISFQVELNYERGENIRLSLLTEIVRADEVLRQMDEHFSAFFSSPYFLHDTPQQQVFANAFFMYFPSNSIQYGIYQVPKVGVEHNMEYYRMATEFSLCMLRALQTPIEENTILMFAFYLHVVLARELTQSGLHHPSDLLPEALDSQTGLMHEEFESNKTVLLSIKKELMQENLKDLPHWLLEWSRICKNDAIRQLNNGISGKAIYFQLSNSIAKLLGYNDQVASMLDYFIRRTLATVPGTMKIQL